MAVVAELLLRQVRESRSLRQRLPAVAGILRHPRFPRIAEAVEPILARSAMEEPAMLAAIEGRRAGEEEQRVAAYQQRADGGRFVEAQPQDVRASRQVEMGGLGL